MSRQRTGWIFVIVLLAIVVPATLAAAQPPASADKPPAGQGRAPAEKPAASQNKPAASETSAPGQPVNVKLDFTITDQSGPQEPAKKTVTMLVADRYAGAIRSIANTVRATLNVDATPQILPNGNIRVIVGIEYNPRQSLTTPDKVKGTTGDLTAGDGTGGSSLNQRVVVVLEPDKPLILSQAADPLSDRKITVEIRATVLK